MTEVMIKAEGLTKHFGDFPAVSDISFTINRGQVVAFLGPNGAGKSTTMRMLTGFIAPTHGRVEIAGIDLAGTVATVRLQLDNWTGARFTDLFTLAKVDGKWKIINKVFHTHT